MKHVSEMSRKEYRQALNEAKGLVGSKSTTVETQTPLEQLATYARNAGMLCSTADLARLADLSGLNTDTDGKLLNGASFIDGIRTQKPHLFNTAKHARDMTPEEYRKARALLRGK